MVALDRSRMTAALRNADKVDELDVFKRFYADGHARRDSFIRPVCFKFPDDSGRRGIQFFEMTKERLGDFFFGNRVEPDLHGAVAVPFLCLDLMNNVVRRLYHGHGESVAALLFKKPGHSHFSSNDTLHNCFLFS